MNLTSRDHALRIAVWLVIATEAVMFGALLVLRGSPRALPSVPALAVAAMIMAALFGGSAALATALRRTREGRLEVASRLLTLAGGLGLGALAIELTAARLSPPRDPLSVVILGLHGGHVAAAIALATWVLALVRCGRIQRRHHDMLALVGSYWYFVSAVWVFVWPLLTARP